MNNELTSNMILKIWKNLIPTPSLEKETKWII